MWINGKKFLQWYFYFINYLILLIKKDSYKLIHSNGKEVHIKEDNIAWKTDRDTKFKK